MAARGGSVLDHRTPTEGHGLCFPLSRTPTMQHQQSQQQAGLSENFPTPTFIVKHDARPSPPARQDQLFWCRRFSGSMQTDDTKPAAVFPPLTSHQASRTGSRLPVRGKTGEGRERAQGNGLAAPLGRWCDLLFPPFLSRREMLLGLHKPGQTAVTFVVQNRGLI